jgi:outer membrane protein assembly factor BamD (BamD/ComL family)
MGEAVTLLTRMVGIVTSYEMEVAHFYMTRDKPLGAVNRLKRLIAEIPRAAAREDARAALVQALAAAEDKDALRRECDEYLDRFPAGRHRSSVKGWCKAAPPAVD